MQRVKLLFLLSVFVVTQCRQAEVVPLPTETLTPSVTPEIGVVFETLVPPTAVFVQTTPTPLPTSTVTPTPTPVVHLVQEGETLLEIALVNGTTVDAITAVNPGINPDFLQIGQAVVLPPPATPSAQVVQGTAVPIQLAVRQVQMVQTAVGSMWVLGEVVNEGTLPVEQVQVQLELQSEDGEWNETRLVWTAVSLISPGAASPFGVLVTEPPPALALPRVSIVGGNTAVDLGSRRLDVVVVESEMSAQADRVRVTGAVQNQGELAARNVVLTTVFYDAQAQLIGFQQQPLPAQLAAGETIPFTFDAAPLGGQTADIVIWVEAETAVESP